MIAVCCCQSPLIAGTGRLLEVDGILVPNEPPLCVRCYVRGRATFHAPSTSHRATP